MNLIRNGLFASFAVLALAFSGSAHSNIIGTPVDIGGNEVGNVDADGTINFYVPLSLGASGIYGMGGAGTSSDSCYYPLSCWGGTLGMLLRFEPVGTGSHTLSLAFNDLDLDGVNTPYYFLESLAVLPDLDLGLTSFVNDAGDAPVQSASWSSQLIELPVDVGSNPFYVGLIFSSDFERAPYGTYYNTPETLFATLVSVPEPATLSLLGAGLLAVGFAGRRRRTRV